MIFGENPRAVQIIVEENHVFVLNEEALEQILLNPKIADKQVAVLSVAGAFRKGKSFLLNFFLRFLTSVEKSGTTGVSQEQSDWMGSDEDPLSGFSWRGGSNRDTSGILIWSEPFVVVGPEGKETAVLLMDTQGAFDSQSTVKDCATIFALSTMVSSVQIFNISQNVQEDDLQHLHLFTEYGRLALDSNNESRPFQSLLLLVRDWSFPYEYEYGFQGGQRLLNRRLQLSDTQHPELQQLRTHIRSCFDKLQCFLLPHPGLPVATNPHFKGQLREIESVFKQQLRALIPNLLSGPNLVPKQINGRKITCRELLEYFKVYMKIFEGEELPEPKSMLLATAEANNLAAIASAIASYRRKMEEVCGGDTPYMATNELNENHERCLNAAVALFNNTKKMGSGEYSEKFLGKLNDDIAEQYENFVKVNNGKNLFKSMQTPAVLFAMIIVDYVLQEIFQLIGLDVFATTCSTLLGLLLITLCTWAYSRYSGNFREIGIMIDEVCSWVWTNIFYPLTEEGMQKAVVLSRRLTENAGSNSTGTGPRRRVAREE